MSTTEFAAVLLGAVALVAVAALAVVCTRLTQLVRELRAVVDEVQQIVPPSTEALNDAATRAARQVDRIDDLLRTTGSIADTVDTATQVTFRALSNPVIKGAALASGTGRAARRLRGRPEPVVSSEPDILDD